MRGGVFDIPIVHALYQTYLTFHTYLLTFPKSERYTLGQAAQEQLLKLIEALFSAASTTSSDVKRAQLQSASAKLDLVRLQVRLAKDCACLGNKAYLELESALHEVGRMLGGWIKTLDKQRGRD